MTAKTKVGYIGLGNIGKPSALRLIGDVFNAHVYDVYAPAVEELVAAGAVGCASVAPLTRREESSLSRYSVTRVRSSSTSTVQAFITAEASRSSISDSSRCSSVAYS